MDPVKISRRNSFRAKRRSSISTPISPIATSPPKYEKPVKGKTRARKSSDSIPDGGHRVRKAMSGWMSENHMDLEPDEFIDSYEACQEWIQGRLRLFAQSVKGNRSLEDLVHSSKEMSLSNILKATGGFVKISHFFPPEVAERMKELISKVPDGGWVETEGSLDSTGKNIDHHFYSNKNQKLQGIFRMIALLMPDRDLHSFSAGRYEEGDYIARHDDGAYVQVKMDDGEVMECSRDVAIVLYLTPGWTGDMGGAFHDHVTGQSYVPEFNSLVAFKVPRMHEVTKVTNKARKAGLSRASIFGWFLLPGREYELTGPSISYTEEDVEDGWEQDDMELDTPVLSRKDKTKAREMDKKKGRDRKSREAMMWD